jgi:hypothetical protein
VYKVVGNALVVDSAFPYNIYRVIPPSSDAFNQDFVYPDFDGFHGLRDQLYPNVGWVNAIDGMLTPTNKQPIIEAMYNSLGFKDAFALSASNTPVHLVQSVKREDVVYTNFTTITNYATLTYDSLQMPDTVVTSRINLGTVRIDGEFVTNVVYDAVHTNLYPNYGTVTNGPLAMVIPAFQQAELFASLTAYWTIESSPVVITQWVDAVEYTQTVTSVSTTVNVRAWSPELNAYTNQPANLSYTNYSTIANATTSPVVIDASAVYTVRSPFGSPFSTITTEVYWTKMDIDSVQADYGVLAYASDIIFQCVTNYVDSTITDYDDYLADSNNWDWVWTPPANMRPVNQYNGSNAWILTPPRELPTYDLEEWIDDLDGGTNVYRYAYSINTSTYPDRDGDYYTLLPGAITSSVPGWQEGFILSNTVEVVQDVVTNKISHPAFIIEPEHTIDVELARMHAEPIAEHSVRAQGFSKHYWITQSNTTYYAPQEWLESMNGLMFENMGTAWTSTNGVVFEYYQSPGHLIGIVGWEGGWVIVEDFDDALPTVENWGVLFSNDIQTAAAGFKAMGYPVRVADNTVGLQTPRYGYRPLTSAGFWSNDQILQFFPYDASRFDNDVGIPYPSGHYYPGGVLWPHEYTVAVFYNDGQALVENPSTWYADANIGFGPDICDPAINPRYWLDFVPLDYLKAWDETYVVVTGAVGATQLPTTLDLPVYYRLFEVDDWDATLGLFQPSSDHDPFLDIDHVLSSNTTLSVSTLTDTTIDASAIDVRGTNYGFYNNWIHGWLVGDYDYPSGPLLGSQPPAYLRYIPAVVTTLVCEADTVWIGTNTTITGQYYVANAYAVTNTAFSTNRVTWYPQITSTQEVFTHDPTVNIGGFELSIRARPQLAVYGWDVTDTWEAGLTGIDVIFGNDAMRTGAGIAFTPEAIDARYEAINTLKCTAAPSTQYAVHQDPYVADSWANTEGSQDGDPTETNTFGTVGATTTDLFVREPANLTTQQVQSAWAVNVDPYASDPNVLYPDGRALSHYIIEVTGMDWPSMSGQAGGFFKRPDAYAAGYTNNGVAPPEIFNHSDTHTRSGWFATDFFGGGGINDYDAVANTNLAMIQEWAKDTIVVIAKDDTLAGDAEVFLYIDYTVPRDVSRPLGTFDAFVGNSRISGDPWPNLLNAKNGTGFEVTWQQDQLISTNAYSTTNRYLLSAGAPSHTYYPLDGVLEPYVLKSYNTFTITSGALAHSNIYSYVAGAPPVDYANWGYDVTVVSNAPYAFASVGDEDYWEGPASHTTESTLYWPKVYMYKATAQDVLVNWDFDYHE